MKKERKYIMFIFLISFSALGVRAQTGKDPLYSEIRKQDSLLFSAFNTRNVEEFKSFFTTDLEFFHDKDGLTGFDHTISFMNDVAKSNNGLKRELLKGSMEVYPIPGYGAMEIGEHQFCHNENGREDCGTFKFVHIWKKSGNGWKITRVVSYGH